MGLVLAINPGRRYAKALARLTTELQEHHLITATSGDEALQVLDGQVPDLLLFPLCMPAADEAKLRSRLRNLLNPADLQSLTIPLRAFFDQETQAPHAAAVPPRWFYWFRPAAGDGFDFAEPRAFADAVRAGLQRSAARVVPEAPADPAVEAVRVAPVHLEPDPVGAIRSDEPEPQPAPVAWRSAALEPDRATGRESGDSGSETDQGPGTLAVAFSAISAVAAALAAAAVWSFRTAWRLLSLAGPAGGGLWRMARSLPRAVWLTAPVLAILLTLGVSGQVGTAVSASLGWANAMRARWFPEKPTTGTAEIQSVPDGAQVWLNGRQIGVTPLRSEFAVGAHALELRYRSLTRTITLEVTPGNTIVQRIELAPPRAIGRLRVESDPAGAIVAVDGKARGVTPLTVDELSVGRHAVELVLRGNTVRESVDIRASKTTTLRTSVYQGWLALFSPIEVKAAADGRPLTLDGQNRVLLSAGTHELKLQNGALGYEDTRTIAIKPGETTAVSIVVPKTSLTVTASGPAEVWVDGARVGEAPVVNLQVDIGTREVLLRTAEHGERRLLVTATVAPVHVAVDLAAPTS